MWTMAGSHRRQTLPRNIWTRWMALYLRGAREESDDAQPEVRELSRSFAMPTLLWAETDCT
jgi:hypothetical protein